MFIEFNDILKAKRDYYGNTAAAIEFAVNEYTIQLQERISELELITTPIGIKSIEEVMRTLDVKFRKENQN